MSDSLKCKGAYRFEGFNLAGEKVSDVTIENIVTQNFFTNVFKLLNQGSESTAADVINLTHMATGSGTNTAAKTDVALQTEYFRKALSSKSYTSDTFTAKLSLNTTESNITIREVGIFADATDTLGSGTLISRCNVNIEKTASIKYLITYTLKII